ncbi:MAG: MBL fold metallo-hydrolase [Planctomycetota bacterium]|jgi:ribonuclease Z
MIPKMPPRGGQTGFLYAPPYRIQGISVAGEQTMVQVPELDVAFDIGMCPRIALASKYVALSHGHMDHVGGLPYYFSQRMFQRMGVGTCICHTQVAAAVQSMMAAWIDLESQRTQHTIVPIEPDEQIEIKNNLFIKAIEVSHTVPALGFVIIERRSKLREEFRDLPQDRLREIKARGESITRTLEIPLVAYTGDTELGPFLFRDEFTKARVVISECTFFDDEHRARAKVGKHLHILDIAALMDAWTAPTVILTHLSRRTNLATARAVLEEALGDHTPRAHFLMDHRVNRQRYEAQLAEAQALSGHASEESS